MPKRRKAQRAAIAIQKKKASLVTAGKRKGKRSSTFMNGHNMDHNGDGKITGIDFKIMNRAKKQRVQKMKAKMGGVTKSSAKSWGATSRFIGNINGLKFLDSSNGVLLDDNRCVSVATPVKYVPLFEVVGCI